METECKNAENRSLDEVMDEIENKFHREIRFQVDTDWQGRWHVDIEEIDEEGEDDIYTDGYFVETSLIFDSEKKAVDWLIERFL